METRRTRGKKVKYDLEPKIDPSDASDSNDPENLEDLRKSRIRDSNKEYARRMTILQTWSQYWSDYQTREGEAYPKKEALSILKKTKKILCPIESCDSAFTTYGGLRYHYARCNIERGLRCKVCDPNSEFKTKGDLLRHMVRTHHNDLPPLEGEQREIASSYLNGTGRMDKSKRRNLPGDQETQLNCRVTVNSYYDMIEKTFLHDDNIGQPFRDWQTLSKDWELITNEADRKRFYPPENESPHIRTGTKQFVNLKAGQSSISDDIMSDEENSTATGSRDNMIFFTGGLSTSSAWLPRPFVDKLARDSPDLLAISVTCCSMDTPSYYKNCMDLGGCLQFWSVQLGRRLPSKPELSFMVGHRWGSIFDMLWCPLGTSWQQPIQMNQIKEDTKLSRTGLLALACGDGQIRILSVPHLNHLVNGGRFSTLYETSDSLFDTKPIYRVRPIACLTPPGAGLSTEFNSPSCTSISWNLEDNQRLIVAGYSNGNVALFDLANFTPILYQSLEHYHIYRPYKTWFAHGLPVTGVAQLSGSIDRTLIATGGRDRQLKLWNSRDLNTCLSIDRAPVTRIIWDYRFRGVVTSTETAFTSYQNRVTYRYPALDASIATMTVATHRATVWALNHSLITSSLASADGAGEVIISIYGRPIQKKERNPLSTHCLLTIIPCVKHQMTSFLNAPTMQNGSQQTNGLYRDLSIPQRLDGASTNRTDSMQIGGDMMDGDDHNVIITAPTELGDNAAHEQNLFDMDLDENKEEDDHRDVFGYAERAVANKPERFLLPLVYRGVETYDDFKQNIALQFVRYSQKYPPYDQKLPESCLRASDLSKMYCERVCDYPFSAVKHVSFSPNTDSFPYLASVSHVGLCRIDKIEIIDQIYGGHVESLSSALLQKLQSTCND